MSAWTDCVQVRRQVDRPVISYGPTEIQACDSHRYQVFLILYVRAFDLKNLNKYNKKCFQVKLPPLPLIIKDWSQTYVHYAVLKLHTPSAVLEEQVVCLKGSLVEGHAGVFGHHRHSREDVVCATGWKT